MKTIIFAAFIAFFCLPLSQVSASNYEIGTGIYIQDEYKLTSPNNIPAILDHFEKTSPDKNIIFYIHGRGRDTQDEWRAISNIEKTFDSKVIMFHWPSWKNLITRPVDNAKKAAIVLDESFRQIKDYKDQHPEIFAHKKISLLAHSMGNIVVREYVEKYYNHDLSDKYGDPLFMSFVSAGADVGFTDHRAWLSKLDFAAKKFVTMNNRDLVLLLSYLLDLKIKQPLFYKLGLGVDRFPIKKEVLARYLDPDTTYIDLSRSLNTDHRYFESTKPLMLKIFKPIVNGEDFVPDNLGTKYKKDQNIFYITN
jgi:hypothetical protein